MTIPGDPTKSHSSTENLTTATITSTKFSLAIKIKSLEVILTSMKTMVSMRILILGIGVWMLYRKNLRAITIVA